MSHMKFSNAICRSLIVLASCLTAGSASAQDRPPKFGTPYTLRPGAYLAEKPDFNSKAVVQNGPSQLLSLFPISRFSQSKGDWYFLTGYAPIFRHGWVPKTHLFTIEETLDLYNRCLETEPTAENFRYRGAAYVAMDQPEKALSDFSQAIRIDPKNSFCYVNRGLLFFHRHDYDNAIADFGNAIRIDPGVSGYYYYRASTWAMLNQNDKAIADYAEAIRLDPKSSFLLTRRADLWKVNFQDTDRAMTDLSEAIRLDPTPGNYCIRARHWNQMGESRKALDDYNEAIRVDSEWSNAYLSRADLWNQIGEFAKAIEDLSEAIRIEPENWVCYSSRAKLLASLKRYDEALADYDKVLQLDPTQVHARDMRDRILKLRQVN